MRYLAKSDTSPLRTCGWTYPADAARIKARLIEEQIGFCAYSEKYLEHTESSDVEHFDPRLKNTERDGYENWYAVTHFMNMHKPRIESHLPILAPSAALASARIVFKQGQFQPVDPSDQAATNLINFLGWNRPELALERANHIKRLRWFRDRLTPTDFLDLLRRDPVHRSFITAIEAELDIKLD